MALVFNYYEILGVDVNADLQTIRAAYDNKTDNNKDPNQREKLNTAYYVLSDPQRRQKYDIDIGIHRYKKVPKILVILKFVAGIVLTVLDALLAFYWCFFLTALSCGTLYFFYKYHNCIKLSLIPALLIEYLKSYNLEFCLLVYFAALDLLIHFYVRRANRFLKNYKWEIIHKGGNEKNDGRKFKCNRRGRKKRN